MFLRSLLSQNLSSIYLRPAVRNLTIPSPSPVWKSEPQYTKIFINNEWRNSISGNTFPTVNPATGQVICQVEEGDKADIDEAVLAASNAFQLGSPWRTMDASNRGLLLNRLADLIERDRNYLASLETFDNGKPYQTAYTADLPLTVKTYRYYAGWADKNHGQTIPIEGDYFCYTRHEPVGVCGQIIPVSDGADLAQTAHISLYSVEFPSVDASLETRPGFGVWKYSSHEGGRTNASYRPIRGGTYQGVELAVEQSHFGLFFNQGQCCTAGSRTFVEAGIYDQFVERTVEKVNKRTVGDPFDIRTDQGPQIDSEQMDSILDMIKCGKDEGATLETGGGRVGDRGYFVQPTVFTNVHTDMRIAQEEIFGPVMSIVRFNGMDDLVEKANDTIYGLAAGVITGDLDKALYVSNSIRAGTVWVNCYDVFDAAAPFGGCKMSGIGREKGQYGLEPYTEVKTVIIKVPQKNS